MAPPERFHGAITRQLRGSGPRQTAPVARPHTADQRNALTAALPGWAVDAFDFIVVLVYADIATDFGTSKEKVAFVTTVTLLMRPVGALVLASGPTGSGGAPRSSSTCRSTRSSVLCAFAPNLSVLIVLRLLYGIGMGGEWGLGAALAMEKIRQ